MGGQERQLKLDKSWRSGGFTNSTAFSRFNSQQNGHGAWAEVWERLRADRERLSTKPVLDMEPVYEAHPIAFDIANRLSSPWHVRWYAWVELLSGTCGHTYGCHPVWQFMSPRFPAVNHAHLAWQQPLHLPGAEQMRHARNILTRCGFPRLMPDPALLHGDPGAGLERRRPRTGAPDPDDGYLAANHRSSSPNG